MTTTQSYGTDVTRPTPDALTSSVLDHATVVDFGENDNGFGLRNDEGLWPSYNCVDTLTPTPMCPDPSLTESGGFKTFSDVPWVPGYTFAIAAGVQCSTVGLDQDDQAAEIKRVFALNEGKGIEQSLLMNRFVANAGATTDLGQDVSWDAPIDITPTAGDPPIVVALALLEGYAATVYAGVPVIHMPRAAATVLSGLGAIEWVGDLAFTKTGSKIALGGGYDPESIATGTWDGTFDLYATGEVYIERSALTEVQTWTLDKSALGSEESGLSSNTTIALVERMYRVAIDCFVAKATGKVI